MGCINSKKIKINNKIFFNEFINQLEELNNNDKVLTNFISQLKCRKIRNSFISNFLNKYNLSSKIEYKDYKTCCKHGDDHHVLIAQFTNATLWMIKSGNSEEHYHAYPSITIFPKNKYLRFDIIDNEQFLDVKLNLNKWCDNDKYSMWILGPEKPHAIREIPEFNEGHFYRLEFGIYK